MDLGPATGSNVAFFSQYSCRLYIADLFPAVRPQGAASAQSRLPLREAVDRQLPEIDGPLDLLISWDLLNYLKGEEIEAVAERLAPRVRPGTLLYAMIATTKMIPDRPMRILIDDHETLSYEDISTVNRPCPRYREPDLERWMGGFSVESSYLLRNGYQEYIFRFRGSSENSKDS